MLHDVTPFVLRNYLRTLQQKNMASSSVHAHARALRAWLNFCAEDGLLSVSPFAKVAMPRLQKKKPIVLSSVEIKTVLKHCTTVRDRLIVIFALDTAIRANEQVSLNFEHIKDNKVFIYDGKMQKDRVVFIGKKTAVLLLKYYIERSKPHPSAPLFATTDGERLTRSGLMQFYKRLRKATGIKKLTSHTMRRTALTMMLKSGMSIFHLKEISGHEDIKTLQAYINVDDDVENAHVKFGVVDNL